MSAVASRRPRAATRVIAIAASSGGLAAISEVLRTLPATLPAAIVVLQHLAPDQRSHLAEILADRTALGVRQGAQGMWIEDGVAYVAPPGAHLLVGSDGRLVLSSLPPVHWCRPSADRLFASVGAKYGARAIAVVLTGYGVDGAEGAQVLRRSGGIVVVQDDATSTCPDMPRAARRAGGVDRVLPLGDIAAELETLVGDGVPA